MSELEKDIVIAITGATGAIYGIRLLETLRELEIKTHLIISKAANITIKHETSYSLDEIKKLAHYVYSYQDITSCISSGSFLHSGMIIAPCSIKTLSAISYGLSDNLITRAADVTLKERRKLILMVRETPFNLSHIESMRQITLMGGIIAPPFNSFYIRPKNIEDLINYSVIRILDLLNIKIINNSRWQGLHN